eukprot:2904161-Amphidinium_carterae.1
MATFACYDRVHTIHAPWEQKRLARLPGANMPLLFPIAIPKTGPRLSRNCALELAKSKVLQLCLQHFVCYDCEVNSLDSIAQDV